MREAVFDAPYSIRLGSRAQPKPGPGEILVTVRATGICVGDLYIYLGKNPYVSYPMVGGHEIAGEVLSLGEEVDGPQVGTPVVVEPFIGCGECYPCRIGKTNCCTKLKIIGVHQPGGFAEYVVAPADNIHPTPSGLSPLEASFAEPVAIAVQVCRRGSIGEGDDVLVLGCGPIGLAIVEVARAYGARVWASDILPSRLETAASLGAETLAAGDDLTQAVLELTQSEGMPVVVEATGNPKVMEQTVDLVASGGRIVIVGLVKEGVAVSWPGLDFTRKELTVLGSRASVNCFPEALRLLASGNIRYPEIATALELSNAPQVFSNLADHPGSMHKGVFILEEA